MMPRSGRRRRIPWYQVANLARSAGGAYRLHSSLVAVDRHLLQHARRRVKALRPTEDGRFEFARGNVTVNHLGHEVFDLWVRYVEGNDAE